jgi:hypothetical protein
MQKNQKKLSFPVQVFGFFKVEIPPMLMGGISRECKEDHQKPTAIK